LKFEGTTVRERSDGVEITDYWHSEKDGAVFCLAEAPTKEAFGAVHREAHGLEADEIFEVMKRSK